MRHDFHHLVYKCFQLKVARKFHLIWLNKEYLKAKLTENSIIYKVNPLTDTEKALQIENLKDYV